MSPGHTSTRGSGSGVGREGAGECRQGAGECGTGLPLGLITLPTSCQCWEERCNRTEGFSMVYCMDHGALRDENHEMSLIQRVKRYVGYRKIS